MVVVSCLVEEDGFCEYIVVEKYEEWEKGGVGGDGQLLKSGRRC